MFSNCRRQVQKMGKALASLPLRKMLIKIILEKPHLKSSSQGRPYLYSLAFFAVRLIMPSSMMLATVCDMVEAMYGSCPRVRR